jgi:NTE family protein
MLSSSSLSPLNNNNNGIENVLILLGGGSLGAFGVFKGLANNDIPIDIVAGTSIGGVNGAIIAGSKGKEHPKRLLEQFWLELSVNYVNISKSTFDVHSQFVEQVLFPFACPQYLSSSSSSIENEKNLLTKTDESYHQKVKNLQSFYISAIFGNDKMFKPR